MAAVSAVLARYSEEVITAVTHPTTGLPSRSNWLPTIKEVTDACEAEQRPVREREARARLERETIASRQAEEVDRSNRPTYDQLKAKYGPDWGLTAHHRTQEQTKPAPTADQLRHHYAHYELQMRPRQESIE